MKLAEHKNSKKQGDAGLGSAIAYFTSLGYAVSLPLTDSQEYDLVVDIDGLLKKVQVKTTWFKSPDGIYTVHLATRGGNKSGYSTKHFDASMIDYLFVLTDEERYCIPCDIIAYKSTINLGRKVKQFIV